MVHWITKKPLVDLTLILFPGVLIIPLSLLLQPGSTPFILYAFVALVLIDSGHVYTTAWRTVLDKKERSSTPFYWIVPLACFAGIIIWLSLGLPYFWPFIVYFTLFHHVRQYYGVSRWYQKINKSFSNLDGYFLYLFFFIPLLGFHFNAPESISYYSTQDLFFFPSDSLFTITLGVYALLLLVFAVRVLNQLRTQTFHITSFLSILAPSTIYAFCFFLGQNEAQIIFPMVVSHGVQYLTMMNISLQRTKKQTHTFWKHALFILLLTAIVFGTLEWYAEDIVRTGGDYTSVSFFQHVLIAILITPLLCHYIFDAYIWRGKHREAKEIYI